MNNRLCKNRPRRDRPYLDHRFMQLYNHATRLSDLLIDCVCIDLLHNIYKIRFYQTHIETCRFDLSVGCFGIDIIPKCMTWSQIRLHVVKLRQKFATFQCALLLRSRNRQNGNQLKTFGNVIFSLTHFVEKLQVS